MILYQMNRFVIFPLPSSVQFYFVIPVDLWNYFKYITILNTCKYYFDVPSSGGGILALINSGNKFTFYVCRWNSNLGTSLKYCVLMFSLITILSAILKKMTYEKWNIHYTALCSEKYPNKILPEDHLMISPLIRGCFQIGNKIGEIH